MTRRIQIIAFTVALAGLAANLVLLPTQPADSQTLEVLGSVDGLIEDRTCPAFQAVAPDGTAVTQAQLQGDVVYLNFWGRFCETCRNEMPSLEAFSRQHGGRVRVVTVAIDDDPSEPAQWLSQNFPGGTGFEVLYDRGGEIAHRFGTVAVPETYVLRPDGTILARLVGGQNFTSPEHQALAERLSESLR